MLDYLRNDMRSMPIGLDEYKLNLFKQELEFWDINGDLKPIQSKP